jgi:glycosyltransferase involved in cell wall biosynthesis
MRVGIVITSYNLGRYLWGALESVRDQTVGVARAIVVDDGSTDETAEVYEKFCEEYAGYTRLKPGGHFAPKIEYVRVTNRGMAQAKNAGAALLGLSCNAFVFLDADDRLFPRYVEATSQKMEENRYNIGAVTAGLVADGVTVAGGYWPVASEYRLETIREKNTVWQTSLVQRDVFFKCGGFNHRAEPAPDWDLWVDILKHGMRIVGVNEPLWYWRDRKDGLHTTIDNAQTVAGLRERHPEVYAVPTDTPT